MTVIVATAAAMVGVGVVAEVAARGGGGKWR
jgi:hypothetical protein